MRTLVFAAALMAPLPAAAHTNLREASPAAGANLHQSPTEVVLQFSGDLEPAFSSVLVMDEKDHVVVAGPSVASGRTMRVKLKPLKPGRYRVVWVGVSVDTHRSDGKYNFLVAP